MALPELTRSCDHAGRVAEGWRDERLTVALVPTMGALHEGHLSLVEKAVRLCDRTVVSVFVNPTQFCEGEDLESYPRDLERDRELLGAAGADLLLAPPAEEVYPPGFSTTVSVSGLTDGLCGRYRSGHFDGVTTVCAVLFGIVRPTAAVFGMKDAQQLAAVRRMVRDLRMGVRIVPAPIVREPDGLAMSSRNSYLRGEERVQAAALHRGLLRACAAYRYGVRRSSALRRELLDVLGEAPLLRVQYAEVVSPDDMVPVEKATSGCIIAVAAFVGGTRLIDNMVLGEGPPEED